MRSRTRRTSSRRKPNKDDENRRQRFREEHEHQAHRGRPIHRAELLPLRHNRYMGVYYPDSEEEESD